MNKNSYSTGTNIRFGSPSLAGIWWNVQNIDMPTITLDGPTNNTRAGGTTNQQADTASFGDLSVDIIVDEEHKSYNEVWDYFLNGLDVEAGTFANNKMELWVEFVDHSGKVVNKFNFHDCRLTGFGGLVIDTKDAEDILQTINVTFSLLYYDKD